MRVYRPGRGKEILDEADQARISKSKNSSQPQKSEGGDAGRGALREKGELEKGESRAALRESSRPVEQSISRAGREASCATK